MFARSVDTSALLDRLCAQAGRAPEDVTRSAFVPVDHDHPARTRDAVAAHVDAGFTHVVLGLSAPYPSGVARWVADEIARPLA